MNCIITTSNRLTVNSEKYTVKMERICRVQQSTYNDITYLVRTLQQQYLFCKNYDAGAHGMDRKKKLRKHKKWMEAILLQATTVHDIQIDLCRTVIITYKNRIETWVIEDKQQVNCLQCCKNLNPLHQLIRTEDSHTN